MAFYRSTNNHYDVKRKKLFEGKKFVRNVSASKTFDDQLSSRKHQVKNTRKKYKMGRVH